MRKSECKGFNSNAVWIVIDSRSSLQSFRSCGSGPLRSVRRVSFCPQLIPGKQSDAESSGNRSNPGRTAECHTPLFSLNRQAGLHSQTARGFLLPDGEARLRLRHRFPIVLQKESNYLRIKIAYPGTRSAAA